MEKNKKPRSFNVSKTLTYSDQYDLYTVQLVHRRFAWWWLLLLLPLLLFVKCSKDITVTCHEPDSGAPITEQQVSLDYVAHFLWSDGRFLASDSIHRVQQTDDKGEAVFKDLPCSVFSYIFYCLSQVAFTAKSGCHAAAGEEHNFHFTRSVDLQMLPRREDLHVKLLDLETGDPLPDGLLVFKYDELGKQITDSAHADPAGVVTLKQMRYCSSVKLLLGRCYGYADTTRADVPCRSLLVASDSTALRLRPLKKRFTFFVKNVVTRQPIAGAECQVTLTHPSGKKTAQKKVTTSIDGKGIGVFDDAFVLATIHILAHKQHFADSTLQGGPWTVDKFIRQKDDVRTVWLRPEPYVQEFINVDSINGRSIAGVSNLIKITSPDGKTRQVTEVSNRNGVFPVSAREDERVEIVSTKSPEYKEKRTILPKFKDVKDRKIPMAPVLETLVFRTVIADTGGKLLPGCQLSVSGSVSGTLQPSNSGGGEFKVTFRVNEQLTIRASKSGYKNTTDHVTSKTWSYLKDDQARRDIPMKADPIVYENNGSKKGTERHCYDLHEPGQFTFEWRLCDVCTMLIVTDENGNELKRFGRNAPGGDGKGPQYTPPSGSAVVNCPTRQVCVTRVDVNGDACWYRISRK